jgi:hypothetical protein
VFARGGEEKRSLKSSVGTNVLLVVLVDSFLQRLVSERLLLLRDDTAEFHLKFG